MILRSDAEYVIVVLLEANPSLFQGSVWGISLASCFRSPRYAKLPGRLKKVVAEYVELEAEKREKGNNDKTFVGFAPGHAPSCMLSRENIWQALIWPRPKI